MRQRRSGFTLLELTVSVAALIFIFGIVFVLFSYCLGGFSLLNIRQGVQGDALKAKNQLRRDFLQSHFDSVRVVEKNILGKRRDVICMLALSSWRDTSKLDSFALPKWDRYIIYYVTDEPVGRLVRVETAPALPKDADRLSVEPLDKSLMLAICVPVSATSLPILNQQTIAEHIERFECLPQETSQMVEVTLEGRRQSGVGATGAKRINESFESKFIFDLMNTSPRL